MDRSFIYRIENSRKKELLDLSPLEEKDGGLFCSYVRNVTAQVVQAQTEQEMRAVCLAINEYIEKKGIDICYVVNENVLNDLLHNHEQLYQRLLSAEEQNKRVLEKLDIITRSNQELETKCAEQNKELKNKYPFLKKYDNGIFVEYNVVYEREGLVNTICFGKNKEMAEHTLKTLMEEK